MIRQIIDLLQHAKPGEGELTDIALGKYELPMTLRGAIKYIKTWLRK